MNDFYLCQKILNMDIDMQTTETACISEIEYDAKGNPVGITVEEWFDKLDNLLAEHYGEDFRKRLNESRRQWNKKGRWHFDML